MSKSKMRMFEAETFQLKLKWFRFCYEYDVERCPISETCAPTVWIQAPSLSVAQKIFTHVTGQVLYDELQSGKSKYEEYGSYGEPWNDSLPQDRFEFIPTDENISTTRIFRYGNTQPEYSEEISKLL